MSKQTVKKSTAKTKIVKRKVVKKKSFKSKKKIGRPCLLDDKKLYDKLVKLVGDGNWYSVSCACCNITYDVFNIWMNKGKDLSKLYFDNAKNIPKNDVKYFNFFKDIKRAEAKVETFIVSKILVDKDWKAQMTYLERKYPDRWGRTDRHKVEGEIKINVADLTDQELADVINDKYQK